MISSLQLRRVRTQAVVIVIVGEANMPSGLLSCRKIIYYQIVR